MSQMLTDLTASSQPLTTFKKLGPPSVILSEAMLTNLLVHEKNIRQPWLSDATYEVLQDKAETKLRNDTAQRNRLQAKANADRNAR